MFFVGLRLKWGSMIEIFLDGHFLVAVSTGDPSLPIRGYQVSVRKVEEKCVITSQCLLNFFLFQAPKEALSKSKDFLCFK